MSDSYSKMSEFNSFPSDSTPHDVTLSYVSDIMAISMFNMIKGIKIEENIKRTHKAGEYSSTEKSPSISKNMCLN